MAFAHVLSFEVLLRHGGPTLWDASDGKGTKDKAQSLTGKSNLRKWFVCDPWPTPLV